MNILKRSRRATQLNVLLAVVAFAATLMVMIAAAVDAHWLTLVIAIAVFLALTALFGPVIYKLEERPHHRVRLHRALGVVDIDLRQPYDLRSSVRGHALKAGGRRYPVLRSVGNRDTVDEWLRRVAR